MERIPYTWSIQALNISVGAALDRREKEISLRHWQRKNGFKEYYRSWIESREKEENLSLLSLSFDFFALFILIFSGQERKFFQSQMKKVIVGSNGPVLDFFQLLLILPPFNPSYTQILFRYEESMGQLYSWIGLCLGVKWSSG